jgi:hypothetical protein
MSSGPHRLHLTCDYVITLPPGSSLTADAIDGIVWHALVGLLESHGATMGGGQQIVPVEEDPASVGPGA